MERPDFDLTQTSEKDLAPGQQIYWPVAPNNWGSMEWQPKKWVPSAVIYVKSCTHENSHFDRTVCGFCDSMHTYCDDCGDLLEECEAT